MSIFEKDLYAKAELVPAIIRKANSFSRTYNPECFSAGDYSLKQKLLIVLGCLISLCYEWECEESVKSVAAHWDCRDYASKKYCFDNKKRLYDVYRHYAGDDIQLNNKHTYFTRDLMMVDCQLKSEVSTFSAEHSTLKQTAAGWMLQFLKENGCWDDELPAFPFI